MKPGETQDTVEFAVKLEDVLVPVDSHWPIEKYKAIDDAFQNNDKEALSNEISGPSTQPSAAMDLHEDNAKLSEYDDIDEVPSITSQGVSNKMDLSLPWIN